MNKSISNYQSFVYLIQKSLAIYTNYNDYYYYCSKTKNIILADGYYDVILDSE